ncbi:protein of unknown function [Legionella hackeliae]|uniref:Uncharacterized protein n=1 Tax=Legionella hackeliae TaxID=449 RepID=A0A0A8UR08_LEGHA|nr:protein of unknown function [Legionella hackeliae]
MKFAETKGYTIEFCVGSLQYNQNEHLTLDGMLAFTNSQMYGNKIITSNFMRV